MSNSIAVVGLGRMGLAMARRLMTAGFHLRVWNRTRERAAGLQGATVCSSPAEAARGASVVISSVANDEALIDVTFGARGVLSALGEGAVHAGTSTVSRELTAKIAADHAGASRDYVAAPVLGRPDAAEAGKLWILPGGPPPAVARCTPVFDALGKVVPMPDAPSAALAKIVANFMLAGMIELIGEASTLAEKGGLAGTELMPFLTGKLFASPVMHNYGERIRKRAWHDGGFTLPLGLKDVQLALAEGSSLKVPLPAADVTRDHMLEALAHGLESADWTSLTSSQRTAAGLDGH